MSNFLIVSQLNGSLSVQSFGTVYRPRIVNAKKMIAISQNDARQLNMFAATPPNTVPNTKPRGLPAEKQANAAFFRLLGFSYATPKMPEAGGTALAEKRPMTPVRTSRVTGSFAKPAASPKTAKRKSDPTNRVLRPANRVSVSFEPGLMMKTYRRDLQTSQRRARMHHYSAWTTKKSK